MQFRIGKISAKCSSCGSTQFKADPEDHSGPLARFYCALCGTAMQYSNLIAQIGKQAAPGSREGRAARRKRSHSKGGTVRR
jgi:transposase-like protein